MPSKLGQKYGPYEIQGSLGKGGMAQVFRAWDARLHREVAVKVLQNEYAMPGMRERFLREAQAASGLNHPHICTIFDIGEQDGEPYLVMELLKGETLRERIHRRATPVEEMISVATEVAAALSGAHAKGVVHRDIKPANIFLVDQPSRAVQAKVLDFGLAKIYGGVLGARASRSLDLTAAGSTVGTLAYMSPEQARGEVLDARSDLFSLGVVMYETATRQIPFKGATSALVFVQLLHQAPEPIRSWNEAIPRELEKIIFKLLEKERTDRFQTAQELEETLRRLAGRVPAGGWSRKATVPLVRTSDPVVRDKRSTRRKSSADHFQISPEASSADAEIPVTPWTPGRQPLRNVAVAPHPAPRGLREPRFAARSAVAADESSEEAPAHAASLLRPALEACAPDLPAPKPGFVPSREQPPSPLFSPRLRARLLAELALWSDAGSRSSAGWRPWPVRALTVLVLGAALTVLPLGALTMGAVWLVHRLHVGRGLLAEHDVLLLTEIENRTGNQSLDGVPAEGLQIALAQSPYFALRSGDAYRAARHAASPEMRQKGGQLLAQHLAIRLGAKAYLFGAIEGSTAPYRLQISLLDAASGDSMRSVEARVPSLRDLPGTLDRLAVQIRSDAGEARDSIKKASKPLDLEATSNLAALHALSLGEDAFYSHGPLAALPFYQQAVALDQNFTEAQLRLGAVYRREHAEVAAAESAALAVAAAVHASPRTQAFAQWAYAVDASGDVVRAASILRTLLVTYPHDSQALAALSRTLRLEGRVGEALQTAQQAYAEDVYNVDAYEQAASALLGLDRYEAAAQMQGQVQRLGLARPGSMLVPAYLEGRTDLVNLELAASEKAPTDFGAAWSDGLYLDNAGHLQTGAALWRHQAELAGQVKGLQSAAGFLLGQGAVDRALLGDCTTGSALAQASDGYTQGTTALLNVGLAYALCGNAARAQQIVQLLAKQDAQSYVVTGFAVADIHAAMALRAQDPAAALQFLGAARQYDAISITPVLRGRAHVALRQLQVGIVDFQTVLSHRGSPFLVGSVAYPVAELGVGRAFAETGDAHNSAAAYRQFLQLWASVDTSQPLLAEARAHAPPGTF